MEANQDTGQSLNPVVSLERKSILHHLRLDAFTIIALNLFLSLISQKTTIASPQGALMIHRIKTFGHSGSKGGSG